MKIIVGTDERWYGSEEMIELTIQDNKIISHKFIDGSDISFVEECVALWTLIGTDMFTLIFSCGEDRLEFRSVFEDVDEGIVNLDEEIYINELYRQYIFKKKFHGIRLQDFYEYCYNLKFPENTYFVNYYEHTDPAYNAIQYKFTPDERVEIKSYATYGDFYKNHTLKINRHPFNWYSYPFFRKDCICLVQMRTIKYSETNERYARLKLHLKQFDIDLNDSYQYVMYEFRK